MLYLFNRHKTHLNCINFSKEEMNFRPYREENFPINIKHCLNTKENISKLENLNYKGTKFVNGTYLEVNVEKKVFRICSDYEWLYRNEPLLTDISHFIQDHDKGENN